MAKKNYSELASNILEQVGRKENISFVTHCMTRLRFNVKDKSKVHTEKIQELSGIIGVQWSGEQLQIIIGQTVGDVYKSVCEIGGFAVEERESDQKEEKKKFSFNMIIDGIVGCITPILPVIIGGGMVKAIVAVLTSFGLISADASTIQLLNIVGDACFYFLPVFVGATAAKKFGGNMGLGMVVGAALIHPSFVTAVGEGTALSFLGLPVYQASYANSIFPVIMAVFVMCFIEKKIVKYTPAVLRTVVEPTLTIVIMLPLTFCIIGPVGFMAGNVFSQAIIWLYETIGFLGVGVFAALYPLFVITGTHSAFAPYLFSSMTTLGYDPFFIPATTITNMNQGIAALAVAVKSKSRNVKSTAASCATTAIVAGVTEPAIFGINLKYKTPLISVMIGSFVGGAVAGYGHAYAYVMGGSGIFFPLSFITEGISNVLWAVVGVLVGAVVTFAATWILYKEPREEEGE